MATRSTISIKTTKNGGKTIYCHWDGYPANNGKILKTAYNTKEKVMELIALGNLSILNENIGEKIGFDGFDSRKTPQCLAYGRDREEKGQKARTFKGLPTEKQQWNYLFDNGKWFVAEDDSNKFVPLTDTIIKKNN